MADYCCAVYLNIFILFLLLGLAGSMEDTCERVKCGNSGWECRNMRVCDRSGQCNIAVPTCIYKDTSRYRVPNICPRGGHPVVDTAGKVVTCGGVSDCPVGFTCRGGVCCPGAMADVELPICQSLVKPNYNLPLFSTLEVCGNQCAGDSDCEDDQICCFRSCGSKCVRIDPKAEAKTPPVIVTASSLSLSQETSSSTSSSSLSSPSSPLTISQSSIDEHGLSQTLDDEKSRELDDDDNMPSPNQYVVQGLTGNDTEVQTDQNEFSGFETDSFESAYKAPSERQEKEFQPESNPMEGHSYSLGVARVSRPTNDNSLSGPVPAKSVQVDAPGSTVIDEADRDQTNHDQRPGTCPANPTMVICGQRPCDSDTSCPGPTKCCPTRCGQVCVSPQVSDRAGNGRLNRLQGTLFRDIGAGNRRSLTSFAKDDVLSNPTNPNVFGRTLRNYGVDFNSDRPRSNLARRNSEESFGLGSAGEATGKGFFDPRERPLFQYGFQSPGTNGRRVSPSNGPSIGSFRRRDADPSSAPRSGSIISQSDTSIGTSNSAGVSSNTSPVVISSKNSQGGTRTAEGRREVHENDVIKNAVDTAFKLNPPPQPPNNARRSVPNARPSGGLLGRYALSFPDSPASYRGYNGGSGADVRSGVAGIGFNSRVAPSPFGDFSGYGPSAFLSSPSAGKDFNSFDTMDAGAFGNINQEDYKKLGLDTVTNSFNKTKEFESRSSRNSN